MRYVRGVLVALIMMIVAAGGSPTGQSSTPSQPTDVQIYEAFRAWVSTLPRDEQPGAMQRYEKVLADQGVAAAEAQRRIRVIREQGQRLEVDRWNRILTAPDPTFNTNPNAFLVRMIQGRRPGTALDVGMGQGRNAIYLAQQGWTVTGFDPADKAVAAALADAQKAGVKLTTAIVGDEAFDFGQNRWDLIVLSYVGLRHLVDKVRNSLKPGGLVVIEAFHRDALEQGSIGSGVVFDTNELLKVFDGLRIVHYEDTTAPGDFGLAKGETRVVRLAAQKR
jgi:SAM-dependent methyltransferase